MYIMRDTSNASNVHFALHSLFSLLLSSVKGAGLVRSTSKSRPNNIRGEKNVRPYVRPSVHKKFLRLE